MSTRAETIPVRLVPDESDIALENVSIGKDILELITGAMYVNPLDVYREYVQNAADALEQAGNFSGRIDIEIDIDRRAAIIRDNGTGVPNRRFADCMASIGASTKRGTGARGFRGIGRLSGLGYCRELIFRSCTSNDRHVFEITWDGIKFREILRDAQYQADLPQVIRDVTTLRKVKQDQPGEQYFEVELRGVARYQNDVLLNADLVRDYLSQVAPVPFHPDFAFTRQIHAVLAEHKINCDFELIIRETGAGETREEQVYRPHRTSFELSPFKSGQLSEIRFIEIPSIDEGIDAIAWIAGHEYYGAIPANQLIRGLRFRTGNIQIGSHDVAAEWFPESRFNSWVVGEVHVLNRRIVPNGRRDNFEVNAHLGNLQSNLMPELKAVAQRCRRESAKRQFLRRFEGLEAEIQEDIRLLNGGSISKRQELRFGKEVDRKLHDLEQRAANRNYGLHDTLEQRAQALREQLDELRNRRKDDDDPLNVVPYAKRLAFQEVLELVYLTANNKTVANAMVEKLVKQLADKYGATNEYK